MNTVAVLDVVLGAAVVLAALAALFHPERVASVTVFLGLGVLLTALWARLGAPDVALAEAALAAGVTGALLTATVAREAPPAVRPRAPAVVGELLVALAVGGMLAAVLVAGAREPGPDALAVAATAALDDAAVGHPVTAVLLDFRGYDTLLEVVVLTVAAVGALALHGGSLRRAALPVDRRPTLHGLVRALLPLLALLAVWLLVAGTSQPGGAFQAGAVLTGMAVLALSTGAVRVPTGRWLRALVVCGAAVFVATAVLTAAAGGWLDLREPWAGATILAVEAALTVSIGVALAVLFVAQEPIAQESSAWDPGR